MQLANALCRLREIAERDDVD